MKYKIECHAWKEKEQLRMWDSSIDSRIWPCCNFVNAWDQPESKDGKILRNDPEFKSAIKEDKDFNLLSKHSIAHIIEHKYFLEHTFKPGWNSDNCPELCSKNCGTKIKE